MTLYPPGRAGRMTVIAIARAGPQGLLPRRCRLERASLVRVDSTAVRLTGFPRDQLAPTRSGSLSFGGMWKAPLSWHVARLDPRWHYTGQVFYHGKQYLLGYWTCLDREVDVPN